MKEDNGNYLSLNNDDSDNNSYDTPSESINTEANNNITEAESEDKDDPKAAKQILMTNLRMTVYSTTTQS